jgi:hypothetical protein
LDVDKKPTRKHIGVICDLYSLDNGVRHRNFPVNLITPYLKEFPGSRSNALIVTSVIRGSTAADVIKNGDIIWMANGKKLGADLYNLDKAMNESKNNKIELELYRNGKNIKISVDLYDIEQNKINKMVEFGGAIFFESDDCFSRITGIPLKSLAVENITQGRSMSVVPAKWVSGDKALYRMTPIKIGNRKITTLNEFIEVINKLNNKFTTIDFQNYQPYLLNFDDVVISSHDTITTDIIFDNVDFKPRVFQFNEKELDWKVLEVLSSAF